MMNQRKLRFDVNRWIDKNEQQFKANTRMYHMFITVTVPTYFLIQQTSEDFLEIIEVNLTAYVLYFEPTTLRQVF